MQSFAESTRSSDPPVTRLTFGQLDRSQSLLVAALLVGFLTPAASAAATVGYLMTGVSSFLMTEANNHISTFAAFDLAAISAALALLGPGAFSLDARLFGRREIIIPEGRVHLVDDSHENSPLH